MSEVKFLPQNKSVTVESETKLLIAAKRAQVPIRFGCAACRCGTCGVKVDTANGELTPIGKNEEALLKRLKLSTSGDVRLACQARIISGLIAVDLDFQQSYDPGDIDEI